MTTLFNPYVAGNPVGGSPAFVGRADVLREVLRILRRPQDNAIVLYGQRRVGKTSILQHLAAQLPSEGDYYPVYFDLQDKANWPLSRLLQDLAQTIARALSPLGTGHEPKPDLEPNPEVAFREDWLPATLNDLPAGHSLVLLFDEFDTPVEHPLQGDNPQARQAAAAFFPYLRGPLTSDPERLQSVFVIGRNADDLDTIALSLFKGTPYLRVSLLGRQAATDLVHLSQDNGTLHWLDGAVERVWELTHGHPFLTQQLCSHVWEQAYDVGEGLSAPPELPIVLPEDVDAAVPHALEPSRNTLEWLWDGLGPAERVVASALAGAGTTPITGGQLEHLLRESGVRVAIRELQNAPQLLQDWDILEPADGGYHFRVELLRRWIAEHKPLHRVQDELDRIDPVAESLYRAAVGFYQGGQLDRAADPLRQAIELNPNHVGANQLLADVQLAQGRPNQAVQLLERLYQYQPAAARPRLVQAYLAQVQAAESVEHPLQREDEQLAFYGRVLELDPTQPEAAAGRRHIWRRRGDAALQANDLEAALKAYALAGLHDQVADVEREIRRRELAGRLETLDALDEQERDQEALELAQTLADEYPEMRNWPADLERIRGKIHLADLYHRALGALQSGDSQTAQTLLVKVTSLNAEYKQATRHLHLAVTGMDPAEANEKAQALADRESQALRQCEQEVQRLRAQLDAQRNASGNPLNRLRQMFSRRD